MPYVSTSKKCSSEECTRKTKNELCSRCRNLNKEKKYHPCPCGRGNTDQELCFRCVNDQKKKHPKKLDGYEKYRQSLLDQIPKELLTVIFINDEELKKQFDSLQVQN